MEKQKLNTDESKTDDCRLTGMAAK